jgi:hypothetical protein
LLLLRALLLSQKDKVSLKIILVLLVVKLILKKILLKLNQFTDLEKKRGE